MNDQNRRLFELLTGHAPFPWQAELYRLFEAGDFEACRTCCIPTGLGKTSIIAPTYFVCHA
ncbi:MAG: hypothetical protein ACK5Q5_23625 [Planctomycetaceae bacterium]